MSGLLLYKQYLNNIQECVINYELQTLGESSVKEILGVAKDIEDLSYLDTILSDVGTTGLFIGNKDFLFKPLKIQSKLNKQLYLGDIAGIDDTELLDVEDQIIEYCGDLIDETSDVNYKNIGLDHLSLSEESEESCFNLIASYKDEITKIFGDLQKLQTLQDTNTEVNLKVEDTTENDSEPEVPPVDNAYYNKEVNVYLEDIEETEGTDGTENTEPDEIEEIEQEETEPDEEFEPDEDTETDTYTDSNTVIEDESEDTDSGISKYNELEEEEIIPEYEDATAFFLEGEGVDEVFEPSGDSIPATSKPAVELKEYQKKEKLVDSEFVTDLDDALAKALLAINDNFFKLPSITIGVIGKVKDKGKKLYREMKVEDTEDSKK